MRIGITVPARTVTVLATGGGGGGGAAGATCTGSWCGSRLPRVGAEAAEARSQPLPLVPPLRGGLAGAGLAARDRATTRLLITVLTPSTERAIRRRQGTRASLSIAVQGGHAIGHGHLDVLTRQRRLGRNLCLDVAANLLVVSRRRRRWLRCRCCCLLCRRRGLSAGTNGFLHPDPRTRKPVKTASGTLSRVTKSIFMGEILSFLLFLRLLYLLTKRKP